jgi:thiol-disulfide isomerase/thioredoxin
MKFNKISKLHWKFWAFFLLIAVFLVFGSDTPFVFCKSSDVASSQTIEHTRSQDTLAISKLFSDVFAQDNTLNLYLFYGEGCPHCGKEREFLNELQEEYGDQIRVLEFEIYHNDENAALLDKTSEILDAQVQGVPFLVLGDQYFTGFGSATSQQITQTIDLCLANGCSDSVAEILTDTSTTTNPNNDSTQDNDNNPNSIEENQASADSINNTDQVSEDTSSNDSNSNKDQKEDDTNTSKDPKETKDEKKEIWLNVPLVGKVNLVDISLPLATTLIAFMDGFNPCAMWILIFLITMLINMENKRRLYILGTVFIFVSSLIYFIFLAAWFNFFQFLEYVRWIKIAVGIVAIVSGISHLKNGLSSKGGCHAVNKQKRKSIMNRIKKIVKEQSFFLAIIGIITLAISVNLIEVVCSAGLPSIYASLLSSVELPTTTYYLYLLWYITVFMFDDLLIFFIAVKTFEVTGITNKYSKWSSIIGGALVLLIGVLLIFKPGWLMFG